MAPQKREQRSDERSRTPSSLRHLAPFAIGVITRMSAASVRLYRMASRTVAPSAGLGSERCFRNAAYSVDIAPQRSQALPGGRPGSKVHAKMRTKRPQNAEL
jgi:hypothetical protein